MQNTPILGVLFLSSTLTIACGRTSSEPSPAATPKSVSTSLNRVAASATGRTDVPSAHLVGRWVYEGTIADRPVLVRIRCDAATCSGKYFYEAIGETLDLRESGPNRFDELVGVGNRARITGHLAFDEAPGGEQWNGTFVMDSKDARPSIRLTRIEPTIAGDPNDAGKRAVSRALKRTFNQVSPKAADCRVSITSFEIAGLADGDLEDRINAAFDPKSLAKDFVLPADAPATEMCGDNGARCDATASGYRILCRDSNDRSGLFLDQTVKVTLLDEHLLSARSDYGFDGGGAHPSDGVSGVTIDLRTGHILDARDFLKKPSPEPDWSSFVTRSSSTLPADLASDGASLLQLGMATGGHDHLAGDSPPWVDYFLSPKGFEMVPIVPEVARAYRSEIQHVPFAKVRGFLSPNGPASYLYNAR